MFDLSSRTERNLQNFETSMGYVAAMAIQDYLTLCDRITAEVVAATKATIDQWDGELIGFALGGTDFIDAFFPVGLTAPGLVERMSDYPYHSEEAVLFSFVEWRETPAVDLYDAATDLAEAAYDMVNEEGWGDDPNLANLCNVMFSEAITAALETCRHEGVFAPHTFVQWASTDCDYITDHRSLAGLHRLNTPEMAKRAWEHRRQSFLAPWLWQLPEEI